MAKPFNPVMPQGAMIVVDPRMLFGGGAMPGKNTKDQLQELQESLGYRRFVQCAKCTKSMKIFICFKGSTKSCNGSEETHTHMDCGGTYKDENDKEVSCTPVKLVGAVQMATKKDTRHNESAPAKSE